MSSDNETVDVASSDETESEENEGDDDNNDNNDNEVITQASDDDKQKTPSLSDILSLGHNNLDYLSEIYNTAFSKMPKVRPG